jgi:hypothetical protein
MSSPLDQLIKVLGMLGSHHDGEVLSAGRRAHNMLISNDWTWPQLFANGAAATLSEQQIQRVYEEGIRRGEAAGYQRGLADAQALTPAQGKPVSIEIEDDIDWLEKLLTAAVTAEKAGHLTQWEVEFTDDRRGQLARFGRKTRITQRQHDSLRRLEKGLMRRGYL